MKSLDIHKSEYLKQFENQVYGRNLFRTQEEERLDAPNEECGIFGLYSDNDLDTFSLSQFGLFALQHRGQEACGISVLKDGKITNMKDEGLVLDVYKDIQNLKLLWEILQSVIPVIRLQEIKRNIISSHFSRKTNMTRLYFL
jgi:amidophosphoribosyltransferase